MRYCSIARPKKTDLCTMDSRQQSENFVSFLPASQDSLTSFLPSPLHATIQFNLSANNFHPLHTVLEHASLTLCLSFTLSPAHTVRLHFLLDSLQFQASVSLNAHLPPTTLPFTLSPFAPPSSPAPPPTLTESERIPSAATPLSPGIVRPASFVRLPVAALCDLPLTQSALQPPVRVPICLAVAVAVAKPNVACPTIVWCLLLPAVLATTLACADDARASKSNSSVKNPVLTFMRDACPLIRLSRRFIFGIDGFTE